MAHTVNLALVCSKLIGRCLKSVKLQACSINHSLAFLLLYGCHDFSPRHGAAFIFVVLLYFFFSSPPPRSWSLRLTCHQETPRDTSLWQSTTVSLSRVKAQWWQGLFFLGLLALVTMWRFLPWRWVSHFYSPQFSWWKETLNKEESVLFQSEIIQLFSVSVCCWGFFRTLL